MQPNQSFRWTWRGWGRLSVRTLAGVVLLAVPLFALIQLVPGLLPHAAGGSETAAKAAQLPASPLTFDAPAQTVHQAAVWQKAADAEAARVARASQEEPTVLDDWHFTQSSWMQSTGWQSSWMGSSPMRSNEFFTFFFGFGDSIFSFHPSSFGVPSVFILQVSRFTTVIIETFSFPRFFHRHNGGEGEFSHGNDGHHDHHDHHHPHVSPDR